MHVDNVRNCLNCNRGVTVRDLAPGVYTVEVGGEGIRNGMNPEAQLPHQAIVTAWDGKGRACFRALDGKGDRATIELKDQGYITAFVVDSNSADNSGSVDVAIYGARGIEEGKGAGGKIPPPQAASIEFSGIRSVD